MSDGLLLQARDEWVTAISGALPGLQTCQAHPGAFDPDEIQQLSFNSPAVLVALIDAGSASEAGDGVLDLQARFVAFILTSDIDALARDRAAINLVEGVIKIIRTGGQSGDDRRPVTASDIGEIRNLHSDALRRQGMSAWEAGWSQTLRINSALHPDGEAIDLIAYLGHAPEIGSGHEPDYLELEIGHA